MDLQLTILEKTLVILEQIMAFVAGKYIPGTYLHILAFLIHSSKFAIFLEYENQGLKGYLPQRNFCSEPR